MTDKVKLSEVESAKLEAMRLRFRKVLGENVSAHVVKNTRKNIAKCVKSLRNGEDKNA